MNKICIKIIIKIMINIIKNGLNQIKNNKILIWKLKNLKLKKTKLPINISLMSIFRLSHQLRLY